MFFMIKMKPKEEVLNNQIGRVEAVVKLPQIQMAPLRFLFFSNLQVYGVHHPLRPPLTSIGRPVTSGYRLWFRKPLSLPAYGPPRALLLKDLIFYQNLELLTIRKT